MAQTPNLDLYYSFPGSLPHKSFVEQLSENMSKIDSAYSLISSALSNMSSQIAGAYSAANEAYSAANEKATEDTFTTTVSTQGWTGFGGPTLDAFVVNQTLSNGDKIHFDTTKGDELAAFIMHMGDEYGNMGTAILYNADYTFRLTYSITTEGGVKVKTLLVTDLSGTYPVYSSEAGEHIDWWTSETFTCVQGFQNLDANGDFVLTLSQDTTINNIEDFTPAEWNGVIIGIQEGADNPITAPYTKTVFLTGILATDNPVCDIVVSDTYATAEQELIDWSNIYKITTDNGSITLYAKEPPVGAMTIQLKVVR